MIAERAGGLFAMEGGGAVIESLTPMCKAGYTEQLHTWLPLLMSFLLLGTDRL